MGIKLKGYNEVSKMKLPAGGYVCEVLSAQIIEPHGRRPKLSLNVDISEGEYAGYFSRLFAERYSSNSSVDWIRAATLDRYIFGANDKVTRPFSMLIGMIERSNDWKVNPDDFDEQELVGKKLGVVFGEREYEYNGQVYVAVEARWAITVDEIKRGDYQMPEKKLLEGRAGDGDFADLPF